MPRRLFAILLMTSAGSLAAQTKEAGEIGRRYSPDAMRPAPLPLTSAYQRDRASFADVSLPASVKSIQQRVDPRRPGPAPFAPANLPDPFEHRRAITFGAAIPEATTLPLQVVAPTK